jgi:hypothetical protein
VNVERSGRWSGIAVIRYPQFPRDSMIARLEFDLRHANGELLGTGGIQLQSSTSASTISHPLAVTGTAGDGGATLRFEVSNSALRGFTFIGRWVEPNQLRGRVDGSGFQDTPITFNRLRPDTLRSSAPTNYPELELMPDGGETPAAVISRF